MKEFIYHFLVKALAIGLGILSASLGWGFMAKSVGFGLRILCGFVFFMAPISVIWLVIITSRKRK